MRALAPSLIIAVAALGCGAPSFEVAVESTTTIEGQSGGLLVELLPPRFSGFTGLDVSQTSDFKNSGYPKDRIASARLRSLVLTITAPAGSNFDFLDRIAFLVGAEGLPTRQVASLEPVARGQGSLTFALDALELAPYVLSDTLSLTTDAKGRPPSQDLTIQGRAVFEVVPKLF
jgi:hypothetical protein